MKYIYADSMDLVDPNYDFLEDRNGPLRSPYWDDVYPHEIMGYAPYDGVLVSRGIVGDHRVTGKYSEAQAMRFRRVGAREFLRLDRPKLAKLSIFGDCGAFTYHKEDEPPYTPDEMVEFYHDGQFTHGCSVDHIIFDFDETVPGMQGGSPEARRRFEITLDNADRFLRVAKRHANSFVPLGVVQGWSPGSMAEAARRLRKMGYRYLAIGGMVPLKTPQIKACLHAIREAIPNDTKLHILGFAKADDIASFAPFNIESFDTTSPLLRAFKDQKSNYYLPGSNGKLTYYTAIRIPQALENTKLLRLVKQGTVHQEKLVDLERLALSRLRAFDRGRASLAATLEAILEYSSLAEFGAPLAALPGSSGFGDLRARYERTLRDRPWKHCGCPICAALSVEVIIFRASNRNKRRGIHNMGVFKALVDRIGEQEFVDEDVDLCGRACASEQGAHRSDIRSKSVGRSKVRSDRSDRAKHKG